jgi:hypothetical protein
VVIRKYGRAFETLRGRIVFAELKSRALQKNASLLYDEFFRVTGM